MNDLEQRHREADAKEDYHESAAERAAVAFGEFISGFIAVFSAVAMFALTVFIVNLIVRAI